MFKSLSTSRAPGFSSGEEKTSSTPLFILVFVALRNLTLPRGQNIMPLGIIELNDNIAKMSKVPRNDQAGWEKLTRTANK